MSYNNTTIITGNTGAEAKEILTDKGKIFAALTLYTADSYKDEQEKWQQLGSVRHNIIAFAPHIIANLKSYKKGARLKITGAISYRPFDVVAENGEVITKYEATIIAKKVESAALTKKSSDLVVSQIPADQKAAVIG